MNVSQLNNMERDKFVSVLGEIFENTPAIAGKLESLDGILG